MIQICSKVSLPRLIYGFDSLNIGKEGLKRAETTESTITVPDDEGPLTSLKTRIPVCPDH